MMYLGDYIGYPALWIDPKPFNATNANPALRITGPSGGFACVGRDIRITGQSVEMVTLYRLDGAVAIKSLKNNGNVANLSLATLAAGTYLIA